MKFLLGFILLVAAQVARDFNGDFGRDLLKQHYEATKGSPHKH